MLRSVFYRFCSTLRLLLVLLVAIGAAAQEESDWPSAQVQVASTFLPGSEQELLLTWRNVQRLELEVLTLDLTADPGTRYGSTEWIVTKGRPIVRCLTYETHTAHGESGRAIVTLDPPLPRGAYFVSGTTSGPGPRMGVSGALLLVTDAHILVQTTANAAKIFFSDVETGEPIANARVRITADHPSQPATVTRTGADGTVELELPRFGKRVIAAAAGSQQAYLDFQFSRYEESRSAVRWRIHGSTDRPAYRAGETVRWKVIARTGGEERWETPVARSVEYKIEGPSGTRAVLAQGTATLNAFGSFWGEAVLTPDMPPGDYSIVCREDGNFVDSARLFELEEPPHPALTLKVVTPEGRRYLPGDAIEATIEASDASSGPIAGAEVEATVFRRPLSIVGHAQKPSPFGGWVAPREYYAADDILKVETLRTDANGRAILRVDTRDALDVTYRIEARIADAAGGEATGGKTLNITHRAYGVAVEPERTVLRPNERVVVRFRLSDADGAPVAAGGTVDVRRRRGTDRTGTDEKVLAAKVASGATGEAAFTFTPKKAGYYVVRWTGIDAPGASASERSTGEAAIWVAGPATTDLGYAPERGLQVHVDRETARAGESVSVLIAVPSAGQRVLFTAAAERPFDFRLLHLDGTVKLLQLALDERHVPNFTVAASSIHKREMSRDSKEILVPPAERFLTVEVKPGRTEFAPGEEVTLTITTRDHAGKPVPAEVALAVTDEAVTAVRYDFSPDLHGLFYKERRPAHVGVTGSVRSQEYVRRTAEEVREAATAAQSVAPIVKPPAAAPGPYVVNEHPRPDRRLVLASIDVPLQSDSRSTVLWAPGLVTGANGTATIRFTLPDLPTTWRVRARAATARAAFGTAVVYLRSGHER